MIVQGLVIKATELLKDTVFERANILITEVNDKGAIGFVLNHPYGRSLNDLEEFSGSLAVPLFEGGPVEAEHIYFIHMRPDLVEGGTPVAAGIYVGGDFSEAVSSLNEGSLTTKHIKVFVGYCGWYAGELEAEIAEGSWEVLGPAEDAERKTAVFQSY